VNKKIEISKGGEICVRWNVKPIDYSRENERNIICAFAKKYEVPVNKVKVEVNFINENGDLTYDALNTENIANIKDPKFQQELFKQYIAENKIENVDFDEIVKIDSTINALINYDSYENGKRYSIKWVKWSNYLSYGEDNFFDFTKLHGLVLLNGQPANECGKSTFAYDLLHFLLFGNKVTSEKSRTLDQIFNNYKPEATKVEVEGCITIEGHDYIIKRTLTRPELGKKTRNVTQRVEYFEINDGGYKVELTDTNLNEARTTKTTKVISDALGGEEDFNMIISANAKDLDSLISLKETERGRLLSRWIGLSVIEDKDVKAREMWNKDISKKRYCAIYNREQLSSEIEVLNNKSKLEEEYIKSEEKRAKEAEKEIKKLNKERAALIESRKFIDTSISGYDIKTIENELEEITKKGKDTNYQKQQYEKKLKEFGEITVDEDDYKRKLTEKEGYIVFLAEARANIGTYRNQITQLSNAEYCPTCHRKLDGVDNSKHIAEIQKLIDDLMAKGIETSKKKEELEKKLLKIEEDRKKLREKNNVELKIATFDSLLLVLRNNYKEKQGILKSLNANKEAIEVNNRIDADINVVDASIASNNAIINDTTRNIATSKTNIEANNNEVREKNSIIVKINEEEKEERNWKLYLQLIGKDGICKIVLRNSLPIINGELSRLLSGVADFNVEVSINEKNDIDFWLIRDNVKTRLSAASGLERTEAALALRVVLGKMSNLSRPPFILLDEILGTVAAENYDKMKVLYDKISKEYEFILHITHLDLDWHDMKVTVVKENNISRII
jgi:DNA repair exonuclease SbcCD ATPase subunit